MQEDDMQAINQICSISPSETGICKVRKNTMRANPDIFARPNSAYPPGIAFESPPAAAGTHGEDKKLEQPHVTRKQTQHDTRYHY
jgi:hypothetical protein